ncbi:MAG TPA: hypothetical protein VIN61_02685 [Gammaproteobacteria bacterium]
MAELRTGWLVALGLLLASGSAGAAMRATDEFREGTTRPLKVALLPVHATVVKAKVIETENLVEESTELGRLLAAEIDELMRAGGYQVEVIDADRVNVDPRLQEYVVDANRRYDELLGQVRPNRIKRRLYNAGDEARVLADYLGVDAIAFTRLQVVAATGGRTAVALLVGIGSMGGASANLALVDGDTGDLEAWFVSTYVGASAKSIEENPQGEMAQIAASMLAKLPGADPTLRVEEEPESDEDVLSGVEALLEQ